MKHEELVNILYANRHMIDETQVEVFYDALQNLDYQRNVSLTRELMLVFNDNCHHATGMLSLTHYVEGFEDYIGKLVEFTPDIYVEAKEEISYLYQRILNSEKAREDLAAILSKADISSKYVVEKILRDISDKNPTKYANLVGYILNNKYRLS